MPEGDVVWWYARRLDAALTGHVLTCLAGIGNLYKSEALFPCGIDPWRPAGEVHDLGAVVACAQRLLVANKDRGGQVTTGIRRRGEETWVYGRAHKPCRR